MVALFVSPIHYFHARIERRPAWVFAFAPVIAVAALQSLGAVTVFQRSQAAMAGIVARFEITTLPAAVGVGMAVFSVLFGAVVVFWMSAGALVVLDLLFSQSGRASRLVEFSALAYWTQVPWAVSATVLIVGLVELEPVTLPASVQTAEVPRMLADQQVAHAATPLQRAMGLVGMYFQIWLAALQACALRVVSGFTVGGAWTAGIALALLFGVVPWAIQ